jgi:hypothetical protein
MTRRAPRHLLAVLLGAVALGGLAACGGDDDDASSTTTRERVTTTTGPATIAPLTGLVDPTGTSEGRGPIWAKVDNVNVALRPPQAGLEAADVVYEEPVEGTTRFLAVFHSTLPPRIGPIRSTRFVDPGIVWWLGGLYVYSGGTDDKVAAIRASPVQTVDENALVAAGAQIRDPAIRRPHNLFFPPDVLLSWPEVLQRDPPEPLFDYLDAGERFRGDATSTIAIPMDSEPRYTWDAASGSWKREALNGGSDAPVPHMTESGAQVAPTNLIVQRIAGLESTDATVGEGDAWVCSQGRCTTARWTRPELDARTELTNANGAPIRLTPGTTWVHLILGDDAPAFTP